jgi:putative endonuclease
VARSPSSPHGANLVAFVDVKARTSLNEAAFAVTPRQQARIIDAAQRLARGPSRRYRFRAAFDVILIAPRRLPRHLLATFDAGS